MVVKRKTRRAILRIARCRRKRRAAQLSRVALTCFTRRVSALSCFMTLARRAAAAETQPNIAAARRLVSELIIPDYETLWRRRRSRRPCGRPSRQARDARPGAVRKPISPPPTPGRIEFLRFGPASDEFRFERMSYWPERKNATGKALTLLLAGKGDEGLGEAQFAKTSAAGQGLPALERLLFEEMPRRSCLQR